MKRVQRKRTKGWEMPENTIYVGRPTKWQNPFKVNEKNDLIWALEQYEDWIKNAIRIYPEILDLNELKGKNLACWCPLHKKCHVDILLKLLEES